MMADLTRRSNQLLAALPDAQWQRWQPQLERVEVSAGDVLCEPATGLSHMVFPASAIVSLMVVTQDGASTEIAVVGNEGAIGIELFMGGNAMPCRAVAHRAGEAFRLPSNVVTDEFTRSPPVMHLMLRYTQALITQMAQTAVCNRHHSIDQQLCRSLLTRLDRSAGNDLAATHQLIANAIGVRRESIAEAAKRLERAGILRYTRGHVEVLDRAGLEERVCECYAVVKREYDRLLPDRPAT